MAGPYRDLRADEVTGVTPGTYGSPTAIPVVTFDAHGWATGVTTTPVTPGITSGSNASGGFELTAQGLVLTSPGGLRAYLVLDDAYPYDLKTVPILPGATGSPYGLLLTLTQP